MEVTEHLLYNRLSLVYLQIFTIEEFHHELLHKDLFRYDPHSIDRQIFYTGSAQESPVRRYKLEPFDFCLRLWNEQGEPTLIEGRFKVEMSVFFDRTVSLSYRMVIDGESCTANKPLDTNEVISLAALYFGTEHWNCEQTGEGEECKTASTINLDITEIMVDNFHLDQKGNLLPVGQKIDDTKCFRDIQQRYKRFVLNSQKPQPEALLQVRDFNYVYIDVWEDIAHSGGLFETLAQQEKEPEIIAHIYEHHKRELVGLMSFYPYEWPYRTEESFADVCGGNVAIDSDDLILVNQNMCVVFGTYGLRGEGDPTDWQGHHKDVRQEYHVSWPEYLLILEMILAKKYTISVVSDIYLDSSLELTSLSNTRVLIENNSREGVKATKVLMKLDAVKYSRYISHKIMFERTSRRLEVEQEMERLNSTIKQIDKYLFNISEMRKLRQSTLLNVVLGIISAASLFGILFQSIEIPFLNALGLNEFAGDVGIGIIMFTIGLIVLSGVALIFLSLRNNSLKR